MCLESLFQIMRVQLFQIMRVQLFQIMRVQLFLSTRINLHFTRGQSSLFQVNIFLDLKNDFFMEKI